MGDRKVPALVPVFELTCRRCHAVVSACALCAVSFSEHARVVCHADGRHVHPECTAKAR